MALRVCVLPLAITLMAPCVNLALMVVMYHRVNRAPLVWVLPPTSLRVHLVMAPPQHVHRAPLASPLTVTVLRVNCVPQEHLPPLMAKIVFVLSVITLIEL